MSFLINSIRVPQFIQNVSFEEVFVMRMYNSDSPHSVRVSEIGQIVSLPCEVDSPRRNRRERMRCCIRTAQPTLVSRCFMAA